MLERLVVQNYKSLAGIQLHLKPFTVFVGPNNSGKSNIFDCLFFLKELVHQGPTAVSSRGGFKYIVWGGDIKRPIAFDLEAVILEPSRSLPVGYRIELVGGPVHHQLVSERFFLNTSPQRRILLESSGGKGKVWDEHGQELGGFSGEHCWIAHYSDTDQFPIHSTFAQYLNNWSFHNFVPSKMQDPLPAKKDLRLLSEGDNISSVLHTLHSEYEENFEEIEGLLKTGMPELGRLFTALTEEGQTYATSQEKGFSLKVPIWAMADGTRRFLAHLIVLHSPSPPHLVCFEEPELYIHPRLMELLVNVFKSASEKTQVLVSTHSPYFLDFIEPEDLIIVEKTEGMTKCKTIADKKGLKEALKVLGLGELWCSGDLGGVP
ncbi:MAG: AAA family ATPase [bacterium]